VHVNDQVIVIEPSITLGALVTEHPELARELERRGLDYCCGGRATLGEACAALGLPFDAVAEHLAAACETAPSPDWASMGAAELADHLVATHHRYLWDELPRLGALVQKVHAAHGGRHPELGRVAALYGALRADLEPHLLKEERVLFPMIRELAIAGAAADVQRGSLRNPISVMLAEHDRVGELLAELRDATDQFTVPTDGCASYTACFDALEQLEADTHLHVHKENNLLFPMVVALEAE
jgi:regulator of cell morphogenesis and NO signaling